MPYLTLKLHAQPGLCLHHNHQQQIPWTNPAFPLGKPLPPLKPTSLATKTEQRRSHPQRRHRHRKRIGHFRPNPCLEPSTLIEPDPPHHFEVLFEDAHLLAVNKPSGLPTLPGGGFMENTLLRRVQKQTPTANPVHRLG